MRKISISTCFDYNISFDTQVELIGKTGFSHISLGSYINHSRYLSKEGRLKIKELLDTYQLQIDSIHGPQIGSMGTSIQGFKDIIFAAQNLSIPVIVIHGSPFEIQQEEFSENLEFLLENCTILEPILKETGVTFAFENLLPGLATDLIEYALKELDPKHFGFCYDSSHDQIGGPRNSGLLEKLKDRLFAVHLSDRIKDFEDHAIPGEGFIRWDETIRQLKNSSFNSPVLLELMMKYSKIKEVPLFLESAYKEGCLIYDKIFSTTY
ncbi:MAG: sugar phosphate isomerase/epimerase [bacterium]|nr:sugar phosphate isomerase/epimerase [bacterium]